MRQSSIKPALINRLPDRQSSTVQLPDHYFPVTPSPAIITARIAFQRGFSLAETLIALLLFGLIMVVLLSYHQHITSAFHRQWQYRQAWRLASQQTELSPPPLPPGFTLIRQESPLAGCRLITATVSSGDGLQGRLSQLHCSP